jgi:putative intracellular protease/amidase
MVIANRDFYYQEYADTRASLEGEGVAVVVAAATTRRAIPHGGNPRWLVHVDRALTAVDAADYSAIVFVGGWGSSAYQYAFEGTYANVAYRQDPVVTRSVNELINDFVAQDKYVAAICHGVSVLAWARVDGVSPLAGRTLAAWAGGGPGFKLDGETFPDATVATRWHIEKNGGSMPLSAAAGDPLTSADDVIIDGRIITAENYDSARRFGEVIAATVATQ